MQTLRQNRYEVKPTPVAGFSRPSAHLPRPLTFPPRRRFKPIAREEILKAAQAIAQAVRPEKVILFGSYAYGKPTEDSDVDLLVIHRVSSRPARVNVALKAHKALEPRLFPVDIVVRSTKQIRERVGHGDFFLEEITSKGQVLYER